MGAMQNHPLCLLPLPKGQDSTPLPLTLLIVTTLYHKNVTVVTPQYPSLALIFTPNHA